MSFTSQLSINSGFGAIHAAILNLATRCLGGRCFAHIVPQSDAEVQRANNHAFGAYLVCMTRRVIDGVHIGYGSESRFDVSVRQRERLLRKSIVAYIGAGSDFTGRSFPVPDKPRNSIHCRTGNYTRAVTYRHSSTSP